MIAKKQTTKKQTREQNGRSGSPLLHRDLKEKLMIGQAVSDASTQIGFARELAEKLKPKLVAKTDDKVTDKQNQAAFETYAKGLNDLISNVMDLTTKNPSTYELINGTSEFLGINGKASEYLAQISVNDYFLLIHPENQQILIDKINLPIADAALIEIGKKLGIDRSESTHCPPRNSAVNDDLHPVYLDIGKFEFCDLDKHDVAEIQKYMYFDSSAVNNWGGLISDADNSYPNYHHCKQSLKDFLDSDYWKNLVNDNQIHRTINLGAGTPEKDRSIITSCISLKEHNDKIVLPTHYIVDSSLYMLIDTIKELCYTKYQNRKITATEIITVSGDFMHLPKLIPCDECAQDGNAVGRSAFFMLGGTIGNINPKRFMESVSSVTKNGDLLIVSGEFLPDSETEMEPFKEMATAHYNHRLAKQLVTPAARAVLRSKRYSHQKDKDAADETIISRIHATSRIETNTRDRLQRILKIVFKYENGGTNFDVVEANRYVEKEFIAFVADYGFSYVQPHGENQPKQLVFEKD